MGNRVSEEKQAKVETKIEVRRSKLGIFFSSVLLVLIIAVAGVGYFLIEQIRTEHKGMGGNIDRDDKQLQALTEQITGYQKQLVAIQAQLATVESEVTNLETASTKIDDTIKQTLTDFSGLHSEKLAANKKELSISIEQIKRQLGKTRGDWLIADAEYLLSVGNQRLHLLGDFHTTIEALEAADQRLRESGDTGVFKVREQLAKELGELKAVKVLDVVGVYSRIKLLTEKAESLAVFLPYVGKPSTDVEDLPEQQEISGVEVIDDALDNLKGLVTIRRTDQPVQAIISEEDAIFIRQQLKVKLQIAVISLVHNNEKLYQASLDDAQSWVKNNFMMNNDAKSFIAEAMALKKIPMHSQLPDISLSLKMLRDISKLRIEADKALSGKTIETQVPKPKVDKPKADKPKADKPKVDNPKVDKLKPVSKDQVDKVSEQDKIDKKRPLADDSQTL
jgi:uncharacterized protein HemX